LWGENYYEAKARKWKTNEEAEDGSILQRAFVEFIMNPIVRLNNNIMEKKDEALDKMLTKMEVVLKPEEREKQGKELLKLINQKWINAADALLEMIVKKLPSPFVAQQYRAGYLYEGPIDDPCG
jgi:elongation factor 2